MASPDNARATGNGYPGSGMISGGATPSSGFQHSPHHASIPSSYHKVNKQFTNVNVDSRKKLLVVYIG